MTSPEFHLPVQPSGPNSQIYRKDLLAQVPLCLLVKATRALLVEKEEEWGGLGKTTRSWQEALEQCWFLHSQAVPPGQATYPSVVHFPSCSEGGPESMPVGSLAQ